MSAKDDCYQLIQQIVVTRDQICQHPKCSTGVQCGHHLFKRDRMATAFDPEAVIGLCAWHHTSWAENQPNVFREFMIKRMGERYQQLRRKSYETVKNLDYESIREHLRNIFKSFQ